MKRELPEIEGGASGYPCCESRHALRMLLAVGGRDGCDQLVAVIQLMPIAAVLVNCRVMAELLTDP